MLNKSKLKQKIASLEGAKPGKDTVRNAASTMAQKIRLQVLTDILSCLDEPEQIPSPDIVSVAEKKDTKPAKQEDIRALIATGKFDYVNDNITPENFPPQPIRGEIIIKHFDRYITSKDAIKEMEKEGLEPANIYELLTYATDGWDGKDWVVALGSSWVDSDGDRDVPCLGRWRARRRLDLGWFEGVWDRRCRFAAVRKVLDAGTLGASGRLDAKSAKQGDGAEKAGYKQMQCWACNQLWHDVHQCPARCSGCGCFLANEPHAEWCKKKPELEAKVRRMEDQYHELIFAVSNKYPGETRHQTALRYIRNAEKVSSPSQAALTEEV